jgi:acyl carrier protein
MAAPPIPAGLKVLQDGAGPRVYMVHDMDGDIFTNGQTHAAVAPLMAPCRVCILNYDLEAISCNSLQALANVYATRVYKDVKRDSPAKTKPVQTVGVQQSGVIEDTDILPRLQAIIEDANGIEVGPDDDLNEIMDSLSAAMVIQTIQDTFKVPMSYVMFFEMPSHANLGVHQV